jgi:beta-lactamase class A
VRLSAPARLASRVGGHPAGVNQLTRRGFLLLAGLSLVACAESPDPITPSPLTLSPRPTARVTPRPTGGSTPTARASGSPTLATGASSLSPTPSSTSSLRSLFPCVPLPSSSERIARLVRDELGARKGTYGVAIHHLDTGESFLQNAERPFPSASLYKLGVLYEAWRQISLGKLTLNTRVTIKDEDAIEGEPAGGVAPGDSLTLATVLERMITVSSNAAAYSLLRTLGRSTINRSVAEIGLLDTKLIVSGVRTGVFDGEGDEVASTSPRDLLTYFRLLGNGYLLGAEASKGMREILLRQKVNDRLPSLLPPSTQVAHKTGELVGVRNDAGIVYSPKGAYVIAVLGSSDDEEEASEGIARLSRKVYDLFVADS